MKIYKTLVDGRSPEVITSQGTDKIIGIISNPKNSGLSKGLIVLFSNPPTDIGERVLCLSYEVRTSQRGKDYVKCFQWIPVDNEEEFKEMLEELIIKNKLEEVAKEIQVHTDEIVRFLSTGETPSVDDSVVFYSGKVPITPDTEFFIAVYHVPTGKLYQYGYPDYDVKVISPPNLSVIRIKLHTLPSTTKIRVISIDGEDFVISSDERMSKAIKRVSELGLDDELTNKILSKIISLLGGE